VATLADLRRGAAEWPQRLNLAADLAAAAAILLAVRSGPYETIPAFGAWAIVTGAIMIVLAVLRRRAVRGHWLVIVSGAGSVFAGLRFTGWTGSLAAGLAALAQYSAGGAAWYLLTAVWLFRAARRPARIAAGRAGRRTAPAAKRAARKVKATTSP
jgi:uncharacterized membrane protein HdeD (DUF308 family)